MSTQAHTRISTFEDEVQVGGTTQTHLLAGAHGGLGQGGGCRRLTKSSQELPVLCSRQNGLT